MNKEVERFDSELIEKEKELLNSRASPIDEINMYIDYL
jgi:hypothetical protein